MSDDESLKGPWNRPGKVKGLCDICERPDGEDDLNLQACIDCGIKVHDGCYGIVHVQDDKEDNDREIKLKNWACHACLAVGKEFLVSKPHQAKERKIKVSTRPTQCYLCPVKNELHAMNVLYDFWGKDGRPKVVKDPAGNDTIAWVHTLCALVINSSARTAGCVYGCDEYGQYENFDVIPDEGKYMDNEDGSNFSLRTDGVVYIPHHFVQVNEHDNEHAFILKDLRKSNLKCDVCGISSQSGHYFPIQCIANDENEYKDFQKKHKNTMECTAAFHVGCARWSSHEKRIFFRPETDQREFIVGGYCSLHASYISGSEILFRNKKRGLKGGGNSRRITITQTRKTVSAMAEKGCRTNHISKVDSTLERKTSNRQRFIEQTSLEQTHPEVMQAYKKNPWSVLWYPNYVQDAINLEGWDTYEEISRDEFQVGIDRKIEKKQR